MKPFDFPLLVDENIDPEVVEALAKQKKDIIAAVAIGLGGRADVELLRRAHAEGRVVVTHDSDFGTLAVRAGEPYIGIIYRRPGHISARFVLEIIEAVQSSDAQVNAPFIIVAERKNESIRLRVRHGDEQT